MSSAASAVLKAPLKRLARFTSKYNNRAITIDGHKFPSQREGRRYLQLKLLQANGEIRNLELQVPFRCEVNGHLVCKFICDFVYEEYRDRQWTRILDDAKGFQTDVYKLKKKLVLACLGHTIKES